MDDPLSFGWLLVLMCALIALWPDYFTRMRNGEPIISDDEQPFTAAIGRACAIVVGLLVAIVLLTY